MNGAEQRERKTAIELIRKDMEVLEASVTDAYKTEVESRIAAGEALKELVAKMIDDETQFRRRAIEQTALQADRDTVRLYSHTVTVLLILTSLGFWARMRMALFGTCEAVETCRHFLNETRDVSVVATTNTPLTQHPTFNGQKPS